MVTKKKATKPKKEATAPKSKAGAVDVRYTGAKAHSITPFIMYNANPEEVAKFYVKIFKNSKILRANSSRPGFKTISMRSWLSESMSS